MAELKTIRDWYGNRTAHILERYGADAPRVHYHTGVIEQIPVTENITALKLALRQSQVRLLNIAAKEWQARDRFRGHILDSGCGLGGGSIYWTEHYETQVTSVSLVQEHLDLVNIYAAELGLGRRIETLCCDAHKIHEQPHQRERYNAVVAIDSSCYMRQREWFSSLRQVLKPGGRVYIADGFVGPYADRDQTTREMVDWVDDYFACEMVTPGDYLAQADIRSIKCVDLSLGAARFFGTTHPLIHIQAIANNNLEEKQRSLQMHKLLRHLFETKGLLYLLLEIDPWA